MGTSLCVDQDHSKAAEGPSAGEGPSATKEASARKPLRMRWMRKKDEDEELMEPPSMSKKKGVGRKYAAGQLPPALLDRIKARDPDFGKSSSTHFTTQLDSAMDVDGLWMSQHMAAYTERKANHDHKAPAAVAAAVDPDDAAGREWLVNLFHEQDRQNAAAVQIQRAWRTYKRNSQLRAWPTLRMLESNKLVERCWKARNFRPVTRARLAQLCIEPLVPLDGEVSDWAAGDDDDGEGFNEGGEDLSPQASDSTFRRETNSSEAPGCTARYLQPTKSYAAHAGHGQPTASHSAAMPAHIVTPGSFSTPHQVSFSMQISGTGGGQRGNPASPSRAGSLGSQSPKYSFKDSALLMMSLASGGTSVLGASFRNRALSRQPSQSAPRVQRDGGEKAETSRPCVEKSEGSRLGSHLLFADRERERGEAAAAAAAPQFGREPAHSYEADGGAPADHPSPSAPPGAAGSESGPARGPSAFGYGRMLSSVRGSAGLDAAAASALAQVQLENEAATTRLRQLLEKNTPGAGRDPSGYLTHGANSQGQASGPTAAPGAGAGSPGQTQLSGNTFSGRSSMRTSIERRGSGSPPPGATAPTSRDLKRSTSRMARLSVRFDEDVPASVLGGGGMGSGGSFTAAPHPPLTQQELPAVPSGGPAEHGAARPSPSRVLMRSRQASSPASTRPATSPATSSEAASESPLLSLALRQKARSTFSSVTMSPSKRSMPRQTYSQANLRPGSERWPGAGLGGADDLAVLGGPEYDLTQLELQGEADTAVGMQPSATRLRSPRRAAPPRASASLGGGPTTTLTGVPCMAGMAASRPGMVGMSGPGQARPLSVQTHHRQDVSASAPLSCRAPMGATPSTASSSNDPLSKLPLGLRPLLASCSPGLLQATRPVSAMAQPGVAGMRNSPGGHVDVLATVKKRHSVMASRRPG